MIEANAKYVDVHVHHPYISACPHTKKSSSTVRNRHAPGSYHDSAAYGIAIPLGICGSGDGGFVDPEEVFGTIFGEECFLPLIGQLSLAWDMKTALQEVDETEGEGAAVVVRDAKGHEIISPEEKAKRDEKAHKVAVEVCLHRSHGPVAVDQAALYRKRPCGRSMCRSLLNICATSLAFSQRVPPALLTPT